MTTPADNSDKPESKRALVAGVGAEKGLSASISARFASEGFHVFVAGRTAQGREQVVRRIRSSGGIAAAVLADAYWFLHQQLFRAWTFKLDMRSMVEPW